MYIIAIKDLKNKTLKTLTFNDVEDVQAFKKFDELQALEERFPELEITLFNGESEKELFGVYGELKIFAREWEKGFENPNILFLDFDGVLNSHEFHLKNKDKNWSELDEKAVKLLNQIVEKTKNLEIVISSAWRHYHSIDELKEILENFGFKHKDIIVGVTPTLSTERGNEINRWLSGKQFNKYVILDDDLDMGNLINHLFKTSFETGLTQSIVNRIVRYLNGQS